jgi:hypothetical protein
VAQCRPIIVVHHTFNLNAEHGQVNLGVIGFTVDSNTGVIQRILPGSDLLNYGIEAGDRILAFGNHPSWIPGEALVHESIGMPGSSFRLIVLHDGQVCNLHVKRTDAHVFVRWAGDKSAGFNLIREASQSVRN